MRHYHQLTRERRYQIAALRETGHNQSEIARVVGVDKSTISREVSRNRGVRGYRPAMPTFWHSHAEPARPVAG